MQKEYYYDNNPECNTWDNIWKSRTIEQELEACDIETPPRELFLDYLSKENRIVDAGCGFGKWVNYLHRRGYNIVGIDNNEFAISKLKQFDSTLQAELGDILNIKYPDNYFGAYISMGIVEHFEEGPHAALNEAYRLLKPGGLIFVSVPAVNISRWIIRRPARIAINVIVDSLGILKANWKKSKSKSFFLAAHNLISGIKNILLGRRGRYYHFNEYRYTRVELENFLKQTGFEIIKTTPHDYYDSNDHAVGLWVDYPFLRDSDVWDNFKLNSAGKLISNTLDSISPWVARGLVICLGRSLKKDDYR